MIQPDLFGGRDCHVAIEVASEPSIGRTLVDWGGVTGQAANCKVIDTIDDDRFFEMLTERLARL